MKAGCTAILIALAVLLGGIVLGFVTASLGSSPVGKNEIQPDASSQIYDANGNLITTVHAVENRIPVPLGKIPANLKNAFIATEDARFYSHIGIDPRGIIRAAWANIKGQGISEGASTITQQLARNALLSQEQTFRRKIQEIFLALQIERQYSKDEILEMYLNQIYFGNGAYGVEAASELYFGKPAEQLNLAECSVLAGIPKSPNYYNPINNAGATKQRQIVVLDQMVKYGYLDAATAARIKTEPLPPVPKPADNATGKYATYFVDYVTQLLVEKYGEDAVYRDGLRVYTTLDPDMQKAAEQALDILPVYHKDKNGIRQPEAAIVAVDPHNGYIKAMVGGRGDDQFNRATMAERQPGSAFKPVVYLAALVNGMTLITVVNDSPVSFGDYSRGNYDRRFHGNVTLRTALT
ncbi:MAG: transglycosylase domain-containing protein, partial [Negativicutes bacterium]|nr:transglycosylase domain-containing protein [Negativicutes bacterium]